MKNFIIITFAAGLLISSCNNEQRPLSTQPGDEKRSSKQLTAGAAGEKFVEGEDYQLYERVRLLDKIGFTEPQEAYSILLPKGWSHAGGIGWNQPGSACAGTYNQLKASSPDGRYHLQMFPDLVYGWNTDPQVRQFQQGNAGTNCETREPVDAETYLRSIFLTELGNPEIVSVENNNAVVSQMREMNEKMSVELQQYGAGQMNFTQTAINATLKFKDGSEGLLTLGVNTVATTVPNMYTGASNQIYTSQITKRTLFKYPATEAEQARQHFSVIMSSVRTNDAWTDAVNNFWKRARQQSHTVHLGKIKMMDEQTRRIGEQTIRNGQQRLQDMDVQMRSWEQKQNSQDRMHTEFVKTIREVENFRDDNGKYEMSAGYDKVWSRGDGNNFILSNSPTFDPSSVFQDQNWKEMQKVD